MKKAFLCRDGVYRWCLSSDLVKSPSVLHTVLRFTGFICLIFWAVTCVVYLREPGFLWRGFFENAAFCALASACALALSVGAYYAYVLLSRGRYRCLLFELDVSRARHIRIKKELSFSSINGALAVLAGRAPGSPGQAGAWLLDQASGEIATDFKKVRRVRARKDRGLIILRSALRSNHIYVPAEDFDEILSFIRSRIPKRPGRLGKIINRLRIKRGSKK